MLGEASFDATIWGPMRWFSRALGALRGRFAVNQLRRARRQEALGQLGEATATYLEAGALEQAVRLFALRADAASEPSERLALLAQAIDHAFEPERLVLRRRRARLLLEQVRAGMVRLVPNELVELGGELEQVDEPRLAAEAYQLAGDPDGQARALVAAGDVERLEEVLDAEQARVRGERNRHELVQQIRDLERQGKRRHALAIAAQQTRSDEARGDINALVRRIEQRRLLGPSVRLVLDDGSSDLIFGRSIVIGRSDASLVIASPNVSRAHLEIRNGAFGPELRDLGSRNGTTLGGAQLSAPVRVGDGLSLMLGGEVALDVEPDPAGGVAVRVGGQRYHAPLGPLELGSFRLDIADDRWIELDTGTSHAYLAGLSVTGTLELCAGDEICERVAAAPRIRVPA
jgi:pSer/pThr/pTyr-binding forkhead associated (FHA) protein